MAIEATAPSATIGVNRALTFAWVLLAATVLPLIIVFISSRSPLYIGSLGVVDVLVAIGSAHVGATTYLLSDPSVRRFFRNHPIKMIVVPVALILTGITLLSSPYHELFIPALFGYSLYAVWHFGAQNIGVAAFISIASRKKSISFVEKRLLQLCALCGMFGTLKILKPDFTIGKQYVSIDATTIGWIDILHTVGTYMAIGLTACACVLMIAAWRRREFLYGMSLFLCMTFLFTMYTTTDYMLGFGAFAAAHGLQYIVFLFAHSAGSRSNRNAAVYASLQPLLLVAILILAHLIWSSAPKAGMGEELPLLGVGIIFGLGLAHFWVDQFLWRMKDKDRAAWIKEKYSFLFQ
jgi:hypothetical protein